MDIMSWFIRRMCQKAYENTVDKLEDCRFQKQQKQDKIQLLRKDKEKLRETIQNKTSKINSLEYDLQRWVYGNIPVDLQSKDFQFIETQIHREYPNIKLSDVDGYDRWYEIIDQETMRRVVEEDVVDALEYVKKDDYFVCNHYSFVFAALVKLKYYIDVGVVLDFHAGHAYNIFVYPDGGVQLFEPQSDTFNPSGDLYQTNKKGNRIEFI